MTIFLKIYKKRVGVSLVHVPTKTAILLRSKLLSFTRNVLSEDASTTYAGRLFQILAPLAVS